MRVALLILSLLVVASCGIRRPLMRPSDIPAYEEDQRQKREKYKDLKPDDDAAQQTDKAQE